MLMIRRIVGPLRLFSTRGGPELDPSVDPRLVSLLDGAPTQSSSGRSTKQQSKLSKSLETPLKRPLTAAEIGAMDAHSEEVLDILNDSLASTHFYGLFRGAGDTSKYVDFALVTVNQDGSHTTAMWQSAVLAAFAQRIKDARGMAEAAKFAERAEGYVTARLQVRPSTPASHVSCHPTYFHAPSTTFPQLSLDSPENPSFVPSSAEKWPLSVCPASSSGPVRSSWVSRPTQTSARQCCEGRSEATNRAVEWVK